ncbi:MAG: plastocyanin/azurin family copper-binding protein [Candidatus Nanoarchaeia archaeon]|nr:plastocyanin/azurin family copper-binding protein [Candidatus Nanoarchaeia archaeon]
MDRKILVLVLIVFVFLSGCTKTPDQEPGEDEQQQTEDENQDNEEQETDQEPSCDDGIKNGDETDVDCGGSCDTCELGKSCEEDSDCGLGICEEGICEEETKPDEKVLTIEIDNLSLSQKYVTIEKGTTVIWMNNEDRPHLIAAHYNEFRSPRLEQGDSYNHTFNEVGEYTYICAIFKRQIQGTINVEENP